MTELYEKVLKFVEEKHKGQVRRSGEPVINHPIGVANILKEAGYNEDFQMVGLMHDLIEDTDTTINDLLELTKRSDLVRGVVSLTKTDDMTLEESIEDAKMDYFGRVIKGADRYQNALTTYTDKNTQEFISGFIVKTMVYYMLALIEVKNPFIKPLMKEIKRLYNEMCEEALTWVNNKLAEKNIDIKDYF
ncbi:HD domain-containing protein [Thomasclavelia cocleata]|uniref:HD domain-containing protein n=1 Tax=Thomasclavelia cocleata TaxID=69824 RepID=UPI00256EC698|nr:HD domain-containing protein [Thomasclavelia cocleata]